MHADAPWSNVLPGAELRELERLWGLLLGHDDTIADSDDLQLQLRSRCVRAVHQHGDADVPATSHLPSAELRGVGRVHR